MAATSTDRIEQKRLLPAPVSRVWRALSSASEFSAWFGVKLDGAFAPGARVKGQILTAGHEHCTVEMQIERMEAEKLFSYRWHPYAMDPKVDYSAEPMTLVEIKLEPAPGGTQLTVVESGFDRIPLARRAEAFRMNEGGWAIQVTNIAEYLVHAR
jgi:uncharacterized protein YndB with AHSA1/START domain